MLIMQFVLIIRLYFIQKESKIDINKMEHVMIVPVNRINVNGNLLSGDGFIKGELVRFEYELQSENEQFVWSQLNQHVEMIVSGEFNRYDTNRSPNQFNAKEYYFKQHRSFYRLKIQQYRIKSYMYSWWQHHYLKIKKVINEPLRFYVDTFIFNKNPDDEFFKPFETLGILYLVSLSGMHVYTLFNWLKKLFMRLNVPIEMIQILFAIGLLAYMSFGQFHIGVLKQFVYKIFPNTRKLTLLALLMMVILFLNPYYIESPAFLFPILLSFVYYLIRQKKAFYFILIPLISFFYFQINILGLLLMPFISKTIQWLILPIVVIASIFPLQIWNIFNPVISLFHTIMQMISKFPGLIVLGRAHWLNYFLYFVLVVFYFYQNRTKRTKLLLCLGMFVLLLPWPQNRVIMIDVGQGDAIVLQNGYKTLMIDTGGMPNFSEQSPKNQWKKRSVKSLSERVTIPLLKSLGISKINQLVITHDDSDHMGELNNLKKRFLVERVITSHASKMISDVKVRKGNHISFNDVRFDVLAPKRIDKDDNENSIVLYGHFLGRFWLFTGDIGFKLEEQLLNEQPNLQVDILKVSHHGSRYATSEVFLNAIKPKVALISAGVNNRFQHPHVDVIKRLEKYTIYRTDEHGTIIFDGQKWRKTK